MKEEKTPLISICIPTWNRWYSLQYTLKSIIDQDEFKSGDVEIVISDNASTDETEVEIGKLCREYLNIRYFRNKKNMGAMLNVNKVIEQGIGQYIWCVGSDDIMLPGCLKANIEKLIKYNPVMTINFNGTNPCKYSVLKNEYYNSSGNFYLFPSQKAYFNYVGEQYFYSKQSCGILSSQITRISSTCILREYYLKQKKNVINEMGSKFFDSFNFVHGLTYHYDESSMPVLVLCDFFVKANREIAKINKKLDLKSYEVGSNRFLSIKYVKELRFLYKYFIKHYSLNYKFVKFMRKDLKGWVIGAIFNLPFIRNVRYYMSNRSKSKILSLLSKL